MYIHINKALPAVVKYIRSELYPAMVEWQEFIANIALSSFTDDLSATAELLQKNVFLKTVLCMDEDGNIDIERFFGKVENEMAAKGKLKISIPLMPKYTFSPSDVEKIKQMIIREAQNENY